MLEAELFASHTLRTTAAAVRVSYGDRLAVRTTFTDGSFWDAMDRSAKPKWYKLGIARSARDGMGEFLSGVMICIRYGN